jgi:hypothetical protein
MATMRELGNDAAAVACLVLLGGLLFVTGLPMTSKPERKLLRDILRKKNENTDTKILAQLF